MALNNHRVRAFPSIIALENFIRTASSGAVLTGGTQTFPFTFDGLGETLIVEGSADGGHTWTAFQRTFSVGAVGPHIAIANLLAEINTAARWDGGALPTEFTVGNTGDALTITHALAGSGHALRIGASSSVIGSDTDADLLFSSEAQAVGVEGSVGLLTVVTVVSDNNGRYILVYTV